MQAMLGGSINDTPEETSYQHLAWRLLHENEVPPTFSQYKLSQIMVPAVMSNQGVAEDIFTGEGLEKFYVVDEQGERPLFPDCDDLKKGLQANDPHAVADLYHRLGTAADSNTLAYCGHNPKNPEEHKCFRLQKNEDGVLEAKELPTEKPTLPWYKRWFSVFFRSDVAKYQADMASYESFKSMTDYERYYETIKAADDLLKEEKAPEKKAPDPVKEARKAKLANMTPEQKFKYELAENIREAYLERSDRPRIYLKMRTATPEEIQKDPSFEKFMQTEPAQKALTQKLNGEHVSIGLLGGNYVKWAAQEAANQQGTAQQSAQPNQKVTAVQNPQNAPAQNTAEKKPQAPVMSGH